MRGARVTAARDDMDEPRRWCGPTRADQPAHLRGHRRVRGSSWSASSRGAGCSSATSSQVAQPGDFVATYMGEDPVIVVRDRHGELQVLLNSCSHKGRQGVRGTTRATIATFMCPYHGWSFRTDGELGGVPNSADAYYGELDKSALGLRHVARVDTYKGLIFATWDATAPRCATTSATSAGTSTSPSTGAPGAPSWSVRRSAARQGQLEDRRRELRQRLPARPVDRPRVGADRHGVPIPPPPADGVQANAGPGHGLFLFRDAARRPRHQGHRRIHVAALPPRRRPAGGAAGPRRASTPSPAPSSRTCRSTSCPASPTCGCGCPAAPTRWRCGRWGIVDADVADDVKQQMVAASR